MRLFNMLQFPVMRLGLMGLMFPLLLSGCFRASKSDQFYMLQALDASGPVAPAADGPLVGLGPIKVPAYLDRPQMVTALSGQEYRLADEQRWAERLDVNIARVSAQNLSSLIPTDRVLLQPWPREPKPDVQVAINIQALHVDPLGQVVMDAGWSLRYGKDFAQSLNRRFACRQPASSSDYALMVAVESQCLSRLNRDIAAAIRDLVRPR